MMATARPAPRPRRILAWGGHDFSREGPDRAVRDFMISLAGRASGRTPRVCLLPTAGGDPAEQIARLPAHVAALELGRIEGRLQAAKEAKARPSPVTQAPPPTPKVDAVEPDVTKTPDDMGVDEWLKWRNKQIAKNEAPWAR